MKFLELGDNLGFYKQNFSWLRFWKNGGFLGGSNILRKGGDRHKGRGKFIKGGVETPLHTM